MICGGVINDNLPRTQKYCSDRNCKLKYFNHLRKLSRESREKQKQQREELNQQTRDLRDKETDAAEIKDPRDFIPVVIPANTLHIRDLSEKRRNIFSDQLKQLIDQAAVEQHSPTHITDDSTKQTKSNGQMQDKELRSILNNVCAICRGSCCTQGGDHAYIKVETLLRYMQQHPKLEQNQVLDEYLSFLPKKTYEDSCIYHTEIGCALPTYMRSDTCPQFVCEGLDEIEKHMIDNKSHRFFIAATKGKNILRSAFIEGNKIRGIHAYSR